DESWAADIEVLRVAHEALLDTIASVDHSRLGRPSKGKQSQTVGELIAGVAFHDVYHTGQIQLIRKLWEAEHG
ncbi:MAG TPA: DinB family protein, partial [Gemmatimonadales bacterium]|nr:DinB family protein [Gemmatimonadales bacterium]